MCLKASVELARGNVTLGLSGILNLGLRCKGDVETVATVLSNSNCREVEKCQACPKWSHWFSDF